MDFLKISKRYPKQGIVEVSPKFVIGKSNDIMIRGGDFYAIWVEERGLWSTDEDDVRILVDKALDDYVAEHVKSYEGQINIQYMWDADTGSIDKWHKYCQRQQRDNFHMLDENLVFANDKAKKRDYASKRLNYPLEAGDTSAWDKLMSTLYDSDELHKIEWAIGSIITGDSKKIQKFLVLYGASGAGKSTCLNVVEQLFAGYWTAFDAKALGAAKDFALEDFKTNPLVAIQHDGDLSRIEDNTMLNSLVSHETMSINEKFTKKYASKFISFLFMGTNKPVKITDAKSGIIRRLIDVTPSGNRLPTREYNEAVKRIEFELGAIAYHCKEIYLDNPRAYDDYIPTAMLGASNDFYNYVIDNYYIFKRDDNITLKAAWELYKTYCDETKVQYPFSQRTFKEELKNYFKVFEDRFALDDGTRVRSYYSGFLTNKFEAEVDISKPVLKDEVPNWLKLRGIPSIFDEQFSDSFAQYECTTADDIKRPKNVWEKVKTKLTTIDTSKVHYVKTPEQYIFIDFDLKDESGNKSLELNTQAASAFPPTYAEVSKGGAGLHLHYVYTGDVSKLDSNFAKGIEVKVMTGGSAIRRRLSKCNDLPIAPISSGLPLKGEKVVNKDVIATERGIRTTIKKCLNKDIHSGTKPSMDFIFKILDDAYNQGLQYDVSDMRNAIIGFGAQSSNHAEYCLGLIDTMKFKSDGDFDNISVKSKDDPDTPLTFYDIEVFPNLFVVNWKFAGVNNPVVRMINPTSSMIEELLTHKLVGFNNRKYDNHILYARLMGYDNLALYKLSKRIIKEDGGVLKYGFLEAYNLSYTDVYDFASAGNKMSLKKMEIKMGIHHLELGLDWDQPVPEELWDKVAEYCDNDVIATEAAFNCTQKDLNIKADFIARQILASLANMTVNDTTNTLSTRVIFGKEKKPQGQFCWRDMAEPVNILEANVKEFLIETFPIMMSQRHGEARSLLPYFPGYKFEFGKSTYKDINADNPDPERRVIGEGGNVYAETGMYGMVALLDIASQHPHSAMAECIFGPKFTRAFRDIVYGRVGIKHKAWDDVNKMLDGKLAPFVQMVLDGLITAKDLSNALKTAINSIYGLTKASFETPCRDKRNVDNIVAKRGALFMIDLRIEVQKRGFTVVHVKTDSIKIADATPEIIRFVMDFGEKYGYSFEHEATYERMCLVNKAVYIAKYATAEQTEALYGYVPDECKEHGGQWTATGTQFAVPYVHKTLFTKEPVVFGDLCETFETREGNLCLDMNETLPDVSMLEKQRDKYEAQFKKGKITETEFIDLCTVLDSDIADGHQLTFVGRVGQFTPVRLGLGGGGLYRVKDGKQYNASGATGYRWLESEFVMQAGLTEQVDMSFYDDMVIKAVDTINKFGDFEWFVSDKPYVCTNPPRDWLYVPPDADEDEGLPWDENGPGVDPSKVA